MEGFNIIDGAVVLVIILSAILAYARGFVREAMSIAGWVAAAILAYIFAPRAVPLVREIPYLRDFIGENCDAGIIAGFLGVFAIALVVASVFTPLFSSAVRHSALSGIDQGLGFLFGALRGVVLVAVALMLYNFIAVGDDFLNVGESRTAQIFANSEQQIADSLPEDAPGWFKQRYDALVAQCEA